MTENPFLLPPGAKPNTPDATPAPEVAPVTPSTPIAAPAPARDADAYIAVPPSVESATHRIARPDAAAAPITPAEVAPAGDPPAENIPVEDQIAEETLLALPARPDAPVVLELVLPDGTRHALTGPVILGRDPVPHPDYPNARLLAVVDSGKTVSKTHAVIEADPASSGIRVRDLFSTNGVAVTVAGQRTALGESEERVAPSASTVELGAFIIRVEPRGGLCTERSGA